MDSVLMHVDFYFDGEIYAGRSSRVYFPLPRIGEKVRVKEMYGIVKDILYDYTTPLGHQYVNVMVSIESLPQ